MSQKLDALYYEIEARTTGFDQSIDEAGRRVEKLADLIARRPGIAAAAAVAAIVSIGVAATKMAGDVDREGQKLGDTFPKIARQAEDLSNTFGVARTEVLKLYKTLQDRGEATPEGLTAAATAALQLNQALHGTPSQLDGLAASLGDLRDLFHVESSQSGTLAATLFALTQGKVPLADFMADLQVAAPIIRQYGLSLNQVGPALIAFRQEGLNTSKQVAGALKTQLEGGTGTLHAYAAGAVTAAEAHVRLQAQLEKTGHQTGVLADQVRERASNALIDFGTKVLPLVANALENIVTLLDQVGGRSSAFDSLDQLQALGGRSATTRTALGGQAFRNLREQIGDGDFSLGELSTGQLEALRRSLRDLEPLFAQMPEQRTQMARMRQEINNLLAPAPGGTAPGAGDAHGSGTGGTAIGLLRSQLEALAGSVGAQAITRLEELRRKVQGLISDLGAAPDPAALGRLQAFLAQVNTAIGAQREFNKALDESRAAMDAVKDAARQADAKAQHQIDDRAAAAKQGARAAAAKEADQLAEALRRTKEEAGQASANVQSTARQLEQAVKGALDLAAAFGVIDEATRRVLESVAQVAAGIGPLADAIDKMGGKEGSALTQTANLVATALPVLGGLAALASSLFGESPEAKAQREALKHNTEAIEELSQNVGNLGLAGVTGQQFTVARQASQNFNVDSIRRDGSVYAQLRVDPTRFNAFLTQEGTTRRELQDLADSLNLQVDFFTESADGLARAFETLNAALQQIELTRFATTFAGQMQAFQSSLALFDVTDPLGQLTRLLDVLRSPEGSPALAGAFAGLDVTSAQGRAEAERRLQALFGQLQTGTLDPSALGGLTGDQFLSILTQLETLLDQMNSSSDGQSQSWVVNRSITEIRGERLEAGIGTIAYYAQGTEENTAVMADMLSRLVIGGGVLVPPAPGGDGRFTPGNGGGVVIEQLVINVSAGADPSAAGQAAAAAFVTEIDRTLGARGLAQTQWAGAA